MTEERQFGDGDASFEAAGQEAGIGKLVDAFYDYMEALPEAQTIRAMHQSDLAESREKLKVFLAGWLGGPKLYAQRFRPIGIPRVHAHLPIGEAERDAWMTCMRRAATDQPWSPEFETYFMREIGVPAERVRLACESRSRG